MCIRDRHGLAAHWRYKGIKQGEGGIDEWLANIRAALELSLIHI